MAAASSPDPPRSPSLPAVVLCGGLGTRLRAAVPGLPKVLAPVGGRPFLDHLLRLLGSQGIREVILAAGVGGDQVRDAAGDGSAWGMDVTTVVEPRPLGTAGAVAFAVERASIRAPFFVLNGDTYFTGELAQMTRAAAVASVALVRVPDASRYGTVDHDGRTGRVTGFREKDPNSRVPAWISAGAYLLSEAVLGHLSAATSGSIERDVFPLLVGHGLRAVRYPAATFIDIGTPADYERAATILAV